MSRKRCTKSSRLHRAAQRKKLQHPPGQLIGLDHRRSRLLLDRYREVVTSRMEARKRVCMITATQFAPTVVVPRS